MKFKVGDIIRYPYDSLLEELTIERIDGTKYRYKGGFFGEIDRADHICVKLNYRKTKLGKILYAKSN